MLKERIVRIIDGAVLSTFNLAKRDYILDVGQGLPAGREKDILTLALGFDAWWRETRLRKGRDWSLADYGIKTPQDFFRSLSHLPGVAVEGIMFCGQMALADRGGNELIQRVIRHGGEFGFFLNQARENPLNSDHARPHTRRMERRGESMMMNVEFVRHGPENIGDWLPAFFISTETHDCFDQLLVQEKNRQTGTDYDAKKAHGPAAAVVVGVFSQELAQTYEVTIDRVDRIIGAVMLMNAIHGEPKLVQKRLTAAGQAADFRHDSILLAAKWKEGEVNAYSLTYDDIVVITIEGKKTVDLVSEATPHGLDPRLESDSGDKIKARLQDKRTLIELMRFKDGNDQQAFEHCLNFFELADMLDMIGSPQASLLRKLLVPRSWRRPLVVIDKASDRVDQTQESDFKRACWELDNIFAVARQSRVGRSPYVQKLLAETVAENLRVLKYTLPILMKGNMRVIDKIYLHREQKLAVKALGAAGISKSKAEALLRGAYARRNLEDSRQRGLEIMRRLSRGEAVSLAFEEAITYLDTEKQALVTALGQKPNDDGRPIHVKSGLACYSHKERAKVVQAIEQFAQVLSERWGVDLNLDKSCDPDPFYSFDSLSGGLTRPKLIHHLW